MLFDVIPIAHKISRIQNPSVQASAQRALDLAIATRDARLASSLQTLLNLPATPAPISGVDNSTRVAVFGSGLDSTRRPNLDIADQFVQEVGPKVAYGWGDTPAGMYANKEGDLMSLRAQYALDNVASAMFGDQARNAIAFVSRP